MKYIVIVVNKRGIVKAFRFNTLRAAQEVQEGLINQMVSCYIVED